MILKKRIVIVADIICDEDFDCNQLLIAQDISPDDIHQTIVGRGVDNEWEILDYIFQSEKEIK